MVKLVRSCIPSIVASGVNSTALHYNANSALKKGDILLYDIGAEVDYYCADLTRTYPVVAHLQRDKRKCIKLF